MKFPAVKNPNFVRGKEKVVEYYKTDDAPLQVFADEVCKRMQDKEMSTIECVKQNNARCC